MRLDPFAGRNWKIIPVLLGFLYCKSQSMMDREAGKPCLRDLRVALADSAVTSS